MVPYIFCNDRQEGSGPDMQRHKADFDVLSLQLFHQLRRKMQARRRRCHRAIELRICGLVVGAVARILLAL